MPNKQGTNKKASHMPHNISNHVILIANVAIILTHTTPTGDFYEAIESTTCYDGVTTVKFQMSHHGCVTGNFMTNIQCE